MYYHTSHRQSQQWLRRPHNMHDMHTTHFSNTPLRNQLVMSTLSSHTNHRSLHVIAYPSQFHNEGVGVTETYHRTCDDRVTGACNAASWAPKSLWTYTCALCFTAVQPHYCPTHSTPELLTIKRPITNMYEHVSLTPNAHPWSFMSTTRAVMYYIVHHII